MMMDFIDVQRLFLRPSASSSGSSTTTKTCPVFFRRMDETDRGLTPPAIASRRVGFPAPRRAVEMADLFSRMSRGIRRVRLDRCRACRAFSKLWRSDLVLGADGPRWVVVR